MRDSVRSSSPHLHLLFLFLFFFPFFSSSNPDFYPLQAFKSKSDSTHALSSWNLASDPCSGSWLGVSCSRGRVTGLVLESLRLDGSIETLTLLPYLTLLSLKNNSLSGSLHLLHLSLWRPHLKLLYLSHNIFSGPFPHELLLLRHLHRLDLAGNVLSGRIPVEIGVFLPGLFTLRLEMNLFAGEIPTSLGNISGISDLNISHNRLIGKIPPPISSFPPSSFVENLELCGDPLPVSCPNRTARGDPVPISGTRKRKWMVMALLIAIPALVAILMALLSLLFFKKWRNKMREGIIEMGGEDDEKGRRGGDCGMEERLVLFEGCKGFVMDDLMRGSAEMLGRGVVGSTYRVVMEGGEGGGVVVKRVRREKMRKERSECGGGGKDGAEEGLLREIGGWRHPNVVSLLAYYSSEDELLLVFDYIPNGSLHSLLHGT